MSDVRLVDLDVIKRYSLAIRQESAPASELLASLDASRAQVLAALRPPEPLRRRSPRSRRPARIVPPPFDQSAGDGGDGAAGAAPPVDAAPAGDE